MWMSSCTYGSKSLVAFMALTSSSLDIRANVSDIQNWSAKKVTKKHDFLHPAIQPDSEKYLARYQIAWKPAIWPDSLFGAPLFFSRWGSQCKTGGHRRDWCQNVLKIGVSCWKRGAQSMSFIQTLERPLMLFPTKHCWGNFKAMVSRVRSWGG